MSDNVETPFDSVYGDEGLFFGTELSWFLREYLDEHPMEDGARAIDLGCGDGRETLQLLNRGCIVTAVDQSRVAIAKLKRLAGARGVRSAALRPVIADVVEYRLELAAFDLVVATTILDHLAESATVALASRCVAALRPGGILFAEVHTVDDPAVTGCGPSSALANEVKHYFEHNQLLRLFLPDLRILRYSERLEWDHDHGEPHQHGFASIVARKEEQ